MVDMINSTKITSGISHANACSLYEIFLNSMAQVVGRFEGRVIKIIGDALLFYFPKTNTQDRAELEKTLFCGSAMLESRALLNATLNTNDLPSVGYRITADYGLISIADSATSSNEDVFGSTVNRCFKMKGLTEPNGMSIGTELYQLVTDSKHFKFREQGVCDLGLITGYPIYGVKSNNEKNESSKLTVSQKKSWQV
jgi:class 3 adenylate cyclase